MTIEQIVVRIKAGEDVTDNMEQLYFYVKKFIHAVAWKYRNSGELEDLEQEGYLALYPAIEGYDPDQGVKFLTYAEYYIRQRIRRYLQMNGKSMRLPVHCLEKIQQYKRFCNAFQLEYGREPLDGEAAVYLGFSPEMIENIKEHARVSALVSLDSPVKGVEGVEDTTVGDMVASTEDLEENALERMHQEQLQAVLWDCVDTLSGKQPQVIRMRYQKNMTLKAISQQCGITQDAARQLHAKALNGLRSSGNTKRLRPFLPDEGWIYSMALSSNGVGSFNRSWTSSTERAAFIIMDWEKRSREYKENHGNGTV